MNKIDYEIIGELEITNVRSSIAGKVKTSIEAFDDRLTF
jgi:hypothetical protein